MKWEFIGTGLGLVGIGLAIMLAMPPPWWLKMPPNYVHIGILIGAIIGVLGLAVTFVGISPALHTNPGPPLLGITGVLFVICAVGWYTVGRAINAASQRKDALAAVEPASPPPPPRALADGKTAPATAVTRDKPPHHPPRHPERAETTGENAVAPVRLKRLISYQPPFVNVARPDGKTNVLNGVEITLKNVSDETISVKVTWPAIEIDGQAAIVQEGDAAPKVVAQGEMYKFELTRNHPLPLSRNMKAIHVHVIIEYDTIPATGVRISERDLTQTFVWRDSDGVVQEFNTIDLKEIER